MGDQRLVISRATLEDSAIFERPLIRGHLPVGTRPKRAMGVFEIRSIISAEIELAGGDRAGGDFGKEIGLEDAMLVVPKLRPRIGKQDEQFRKPRAGRKCVEKETSFGVDEVQVCEPGAVPFSSGALDPFTDDIDTNAEFVRVSLRVGGEKMAVAASQFPRKGGRARQHG